MDDPRTDDAATPGEESETIPVVAAVIRRGDRFLLARRPEGKRHGGMWEFPGGKLLPGESLLDGARRELREELGLGVSTIRAERFLARDPGSPFEIHFVEVAVEGVPNPTEHPEVAWFTPAELAGLTLAPADARFVRDALPSSGVGLRGARRSDGPNQLHEEEGPE
jgi:8-oxo-dGTP pyrophosphatase MutT (NUDIX family)